MPVCICYCCNQCIDVLGGNGVLDGLNFLEEGKVENVQVKRIWGLEGKGNIKAFPCLDILLLSIDLGVIFKTMWSCIFLLVNYFCVGSRMPITFQLTSFITFSVFVTRVPAGQLTEECCVGFFTKGQNPILPFQYRVPCRKDLG